MSLWPFRPNWKSPPYGWFATADSVALDNRLRGHA